MKHLMIDLETMGNGSNSAIVSIAAIYFDIDTGEMGDHFYEIVDLQSCIDIGLEVNASTVYWWLSQNDEARKEINPKPNEKTGIKDALDDFRDFCKDGIQVWGNSARFDCGILADAYKKIGEKIPWDFRKERCLRTLVSIYPKVRQDWTFKGTKHHPLHDCKNQIGYAHETWAKL